MLGVLSNSPLKERIANLNRLNAFAKVGKEVNFPNDFSNIVSAKPTRSVESVSAANNDLNLDRNQLKHALFWFISGSPMDDIALKNLQAGNRDKAVEIFQKKETYSALINTAVLALIDGDNTIGFTNISKVIHNADYRAELLQALGIANLQIAEDDFAELIITELLNEIPASVLLSVAHNSSDRAIISKSAINEPISVINSAISVAKKADSKNPEASLTAGTELMNSTKAPLKAVKDIAGATSPQYQMVADNVAKQVLQCGINYYNNAPDSDVESPRKTMVLQSYALSIAVGQLTKDRCKENFDILKQAVDNMPPAEVAIETRKVKEELKKFCQLPDKITHSVTLLNNTKPLLQTIKLRLGATNPFYLSLSTQVVGNALHNVIEEVNQAQSALGHIIDECHRRGINLAIYGSTIIDKIKPIIIEAWKTTILMDSFDMEYEFKTKRYNPNRHSLKEMCEGLSISTNMSTAYSNPTGPDKPIIGGTNGPSKNSGWSAFWIATIICAVIGSMANGFEGFFVGGFIGVVIVGNIARSIFKED